MKTTLLSVSLLGLLGITIWWIIDVGGTIGGLNMPAVGWVALVLGVVISLAVGVGLMFLIFYSNRKGHDEPPEVLR
jgi:hypothetical protein